jgi:hypothetical protein
MDGAMSAFDATVVFLQYLKDLDDRQQQGIAAYPLDEKLLLYLLAVLAGSCVTWSGSRICHANRNASAPFTHRTKAKAAKTVQKTPIYPTVESHAQSTTTVLVRPSSMREATTTAIATPMRLRAFSLPRCALCA